MRTLMQQLFVFAFASIGLMVPAIASDVKAQAVGDPTQFSQCALADFPGGYTCSAGSSLGQIFTIDSLTNLATSVGCSKINGFNALSCPIGGALPGIILFYTYTDTRDVSRIIYIAIPQ